MRFQFDALNRVTNMMDAVGTTKYTYANGLLATEVGPWTSSTLTYGYNNARRRSQLVIGQPTGNAWTNTYGYDAAGRMSSVVSPAGKFAYQFNAPGSLVTKLTQPDGFWTTNTFDGRGRLTDTTLYDNTTTILNRHGYTLNDAHQRTRITRTNYSASTWNGYVDYTYDTAGELRTARAYDSSGTSVPSQNFDYGFDTGWNILKRTNNTSVTSYTVNNLNQVTSDGSSLSYDNNGNLSSQTSSGIAYSYDDENQLVTQQVVSNWKEEYTYDGRGRLRIKKYYVYMSGMWNLSTETRYLYDGMLLVQERTSSNNPQVTYTRGLDLSGSLEGAGGIGGLLSRGSHASSSPYQLSSSAHYHADGNGNVTMLVGANSPTIKGGYYRYDPFGRTLASGGTLANANTMRFSSKPVLGTTTAYYFGYRWFLPELQRWVTRDPIGKIGRAHV